MLVLVCAFVAPYAYCMKKKKKNKKPASAKVISFDQLTQIAKTSKGGATDTALLKCYRAWYNAFLTDSQDCVRQLMPQPIELKENLLFQSCIYEMKPFAKFLIEKRIIDINTPLSSVSHNPTVLGIICGNNQLDIANFLISAGADLEVKDAEGYAPLHRASFHGHYNIVECLLNKGANIKATASHCLFTPLHVAVELGQTEVVKLLLKHKADVNAPSIQNVTPLYFACELGYVEIAQLLIEHSADIETSFDGVTALGIACANGHVEIARMLIDAGADVKAADSKDFSLLARAVYNKQRTVVEMLLERGVPVNSMCNTLETPLHRAVQVEDEQVARLLLEHGAYVNAQNRDNYTPFHQACTIKNTRLALLLLSYRADINLPEFNGLTPLHQACRFGTLKMVQFLIDHKANVDQPSLLGWSPIHTACKIGRLDIAQLLYKAGADVNKTVTNSHTLMHLACEFGKPNMVQFIEQIGWPLDIKNDKNIMPIHTASCSGNLDTMEYLLTQKPDLVDVPVVEGITSLHLVTSLGNIAAVKKLAGHGADLTRKTDRGVTALDYAVDKGHKEIVAFLIEKIAADKRSKKNKKKTAREKVKRALARTLQAHALNNDNNAIVELADSSDSEDVVEVVNPYQYVGRTLFGSEQSSVEKASDDTRDAQDSLVNPYVCQVEFAPTFNWPDGLRKKHRANIEQKLQNFSPTSQDVKKLKDSNGQWRLRCGIYRIKFAWDQANKRVELLEMRLRKNAYKGHG